MEEAKKRIKEALVNRAFTLDLSFLCLNDLPLEIEELNELTELNLGNNCFSILPNSVNKLKNLRILNLENNSFNYISGIGFDFPCHLPLEHINLSNNNLTQIPDDIFNIKSIKQINLDGNPLLKDLPQNILGYGFKAIYYFIQEVQFSKNISVLLEAKMIFVGQGEVGKTSLMKRMIYPEEIFVEGYENTTHGININSWEFDVYFDDTELKNYFNIVKYEDIYGEYADYLDYDDEDEDEIDNDGTYGSYEDNSLDSNFIYINEDEDIYEYDHNVPMSTENNKIHKGINYREAKLNIWDFGGQEIYYSTHQFFLTKRSIYVFVWDARKEEEYRGFEYWFNTINILSEKSPIFIVLNKVDQRIKQIDESKLKQSFPNIVGFYKTSCKTNEGIKNLVKDIEIVFRRLPHIGDKLPRAWVDVREELSGTHKNFISYDEYLQICFNHKIYRDRAGFLSRYLHDLGDILHFQSDEVLNRIVILNPQWVTNAFYNLIDSRSIQYNNGKFSLFDLLDIWNNKIYPKEKHLEIIRLIESFEICFNIVGSKDYIIPELLPNRNLLENHFTTHINDIKFEYRFKFMPAGLIARFICRNFLLIEKRNFWKNGLIIKYETSTALIESDILERKIKIDINGDDKV